MSPAARAIVLVLALATGSALVNGCAHQAGKGATAGVVQGLQQQSERIKEETGQYALEVVGSRVTKGALETLTSPEQVQRLQELAGRLAGQMATDAVARALGTAIAPGEDGKGGSPIEVASAQAARAIERELTRALAADLGAGGDGPLGKALAGATTQMSGSAAQGVLAAFFPECGAGEPRCLDRRVAELAQETAAGALRGFSRAVAWLLVVGSFVAGVIATLLLVVTFRLFRRGGGTEARSPQRTAEA